MPVPELELHERDIDFLSISALPINSFIRACIASLSVELSLSTRMKVLSASRYVFNAFVYSPRLSKDSATFIG